MENNELYENLNRALEEGTLDAVCAEIKRLRQDSSDTSDIESAIDNFIAYSLSRQVIFYGAPGTGKSFIVDVLTNNHNVERTTFHPESDYSSFVGCYKPVSVKEGGHSLIEYKFVAQAFIRAYINACKNPDKKQFLVIEEINRGNCAAIFGDLFQLLDRDNEGKSTYAINCDSDIAAYLKEELKGDPNEIRLPENFYIWATMNTSDQSLFPMDSAFKRRWEMEYVLISDAGKDWMIEVRPGEYKSWYKFIEWINGVILEKTQSQDKQLGYFFIKPADDKTISRRQFINKVIFYLWNDVFRDYMKSETPFDLSSNRGETAPDVIKEKLGKAPYVIESFDKFFEECTLSDFLWNLENQPDTDSEVDEKDDLKKSSKSSDELIDRDSFLETKDVDMTVTTKMPSTAPDKRVILYKTKSPDSYFSVRVQKQAVLALFFLTCSGLSTDDAISKWRKAGASDKWIRKDKAFPKGYHVKTLDGSLFIYNDTSTGHSTWSKFEDIVKKLGVTMVQGKY